MAPLFFAATFPERTRAVALVDCYATLGRQDDYPWGFPPEALRRFADAFVSLWGTGDSLQLLAPELVKDDRFREWFARLERGSLSPAMVAFTKTIMTAADLRGVISSIRVPTLVIEHAQHAYLRPGHGRYIADHIPSARYRARPGFFGLCWVHDAAWVLEEVQSFLTGTRPTADLDNRVLATVLFTDIVGSTELAAGMGDHRWRALLEEHETLVHREIEAFRGHHVKWTGDGCLATFDGPARAIRCAFAVREAVSSLGIEVRAGLHTGEVELREADVGGIAVHIGARVMAEARAGEVLVSGSVPPLVAGSGIEFEDRGGRELKGVPGEWRLFGVKS